MTKQIQRVAVIGCGWLGTPLAYHLVAKGYQVRGSRQHTSSRAELTQAGVINAALSLTPTLQCSESLRLFNDCDLLIINIPPKRKAHDAPFYIAQIDALIAVAIEYQIPRVLFISSTSVYGEQQTQVDETLRPEPSSDSGHTLLAIEQKLMSNRAFRTSILRFGGLIGPGRHPGRFLAGRTVDGGDTPVNLIHQRDCIGLISAIIKQDTFPGVFNACCDGHPTRRDFYTAAANVLQLAPPLFSDVPGISKVIGNQLIKQTLNYTFQVPDPVCWIEQEIP
ncbi:SDR family oxidoreductase [Celerinatantimonas yamalensis]|uniref:SDR family oxidoreductase n=1 Tax=Celerinatantimonas yamalensis TaxID=559956 RepID=A0ABW9G859_9GAMM